MKPASCARAAGMQRSPAAPAPRGSAAPAPPGPRASRVPALAKAPSSSATRAALRVGAHRPPAPPAAGPRYRPARRRPRVRHRLAQRPADRRGALRVGLQPLDLGPQPDLEGGAQVAVGGSIFASSAFTAASTPPGDGGARRSQPTSAPPSARTRASMAARSCVLLRRPAACGAGRWPGRTPPGAGRPRPGCAARGPPRGAPPAPPAMRGSSRPSSRRARPSSRLASRRGSVAASASAAGRAAAGSARKLRRMPARSSRPSTRRTSASVKTWLATKRPSPWPSRSFWRGMMAVCGIGRPSGWRNSAVTANQSAMPPTTPALAAACSRSGPAVARRQRVGRQHQRRHADQQPGGDGAVAGKGAAERRLRVGDLGKGGHAQGKLGRPAAGGRVARRFSRAPRTACRNMGRTMPPEARMALAGSCSAGLGALDRLDDQPLGLGRIAPAGDLHPLARLEVLVVLEEVLDLVERDLRQVGVVEDVLVALRELRRAARR